VTNLTFRHRLFIASCIATFRTDEETQKLFMRQFRGKVVELKHIRRIKRWLAKLDADPAYELKGRAIHWRTLHAEYTKIKSTYLSNISDLPLTHPRIRIEELTKLFKEVDWAPSHTLTVKETVTGPDGIPVVNEKTGKQMSKLKTVVVEKKDVIAAASLLKQIGVEAGNYKEQSSVHITLTEFIINQRRDRGLHSSSEAPVNSKSHTNTTDADFTEVEGDEATVVAATEISLPAPVVVGSEEGQM
jgi:hypothetical protein